MLEGLAMRKLREYRGAAAVEFALLLPILLIILFGVIEFSIIMYDKHMITNASREGARQGIVFRAAADGTYDPLNLADIQNVVNSYLGSNLISFQPGNATIAASWADDPSKLEDKLLTVTVNYTYNWLVIPNFIADLAGGLNLSAVTVMRMEKSN